MTSLSKFLWRSMIAALIAAGVFYYIACTQSGLQLVWSAAAKYIPDKIHVGSLRGNLLSHLTIRDLTYEDDDISVVIQSLDLDWDAWKLLRQRIVIHDLDMDGVTVQMKSRQTERQTPAMTSEELLMFLGRITLDRASIHHSRLDLKNGYIEVNGNLDDNWHLQWAMNVPELQQLLQDVQGKLVTTGSVAGTRMQPEINADINLDKFVTPYFSIRSLTGNIHSQFKQHLADSGRLQIKGLNIEGYRVPDFMLNTSSQLNTGVYRLQAKAVLSPVNSVTAQFILPQLTTAMTFNQQFHATAQVDVKDFSQFNTLFVDVPQMRVLSGQVTGAFRGDGDFLHPVFDGNLDTQHGSVWVPYAKMRLTDINLKTHYHSGQTVSLRGTFVAGKNMASFEGTYGIEDPSLPLLLKIRGKDMQVLNTKEYNVTISPDVTLSYRNNDLFLSGKILVPSADIKPVDFSATATLPGDVVIVNQASASSTVPTNVSLQIKLELGDRVKFKYRGLQAKLLGSIDIFGEEGKPMTATGEFNIDSGTYRAYGHTLTIQQGRLIYAGNLLTNPGLSLRASQTIRVVGYSGSSQFNSSEIKPVYSGSDTLTVGVAVNGVIQKPRITLFSDPGGYSQGDILSYLLFGYPQSQASGASGLALLGAATDMYGGTDKDKPNVVGNIQQTFGLY